MEDLTSIACSSIGVAGTTRIHFRKVGENVAARVGIAIFGMTNVPHGQDDDPFDAEFRDNYAEGIGSTRDLALQDLRKDIQEISDSLWDDPAGPA